MIVGGRIKYAEAKKDKDEPATGLSINVNIDSMALDGEILNIEYTYNVKYEKNVGSLTIKGVIKSKTDDRQKILDEWNKTKKLSNEFAEEVINAVNFTCGVNGTLIVRAVNLAPPMIFPKIQVSSTGARGVSRKGEKKAA